MSRSSVYLYVNPSATEPQLSYGPAKPVRTDAWYTSADHLNTIAIHLSNFTGRVYIEGSLKVAPTDTDWFPIPYAGAGITYLDFPEPGYIVPDTLATGRTKTYTFSFTGRFVWMRARIERGLYHSGFVDRIMLNI